MEGFSWVTPRPLSPAPPHPDLLPAPKLYNNRINKTACICTGLSSVCFRRETTHRILLFQTGEAVESTAVCKRPSLEPSSSPGKHCFHFWDIRRRRRESRENDSVISPPLAQIASTLCFRQTVHSQQTQSTDGGREH